MFAPASVLLQWSDGRRRLFLLHSPWGLPRMPLAPDLCMAALAVPQLPIPLQPMGCQSVPLPALQGLNES